MAAQARRSGPVVAAPAKAGRRKVPEWASTPIVVGLVLLLRLPFLHQAIQGDDPYYLLGAEHALIDPLHPTHARYIFQGDTVDMRGHPHPPLNVWILAAPLSILGNVREKPFHLVYILFSLIAALSMLSLARRFCDKPLLATLLFLAVPAFVVNGNSLEADLPFLAFWMAAIALYVKAIDEHSTTKLIQAAGSAILAALAAYQAVLLFLVLPLYALEPAKRRRIAWSAALAAPIALGAWQLYEHSTSGRYPAAMLAGYLQTYGLQAAAQKIRNAAALTTHIGWIVSPPLALIAFFRGSKWRWAITAAAATGAAIYDPNPLFWASFACGVLVLTSCIARGFLGAWVLIFFAGALVIFFAGSARYLLPIAAPIAILVARSCRASILAAGFILQMTLSLGLAIVNYQHWGAYRQFAESLSGEAAQRRVWINAEWGLQFYLQSEGALPLPKGQLLRPGEIVVSSELALPLPIKAALAPLSEREIRPAIPLRLISLDHRSAYSVASALGLLPFEFSTAPIDRVRADIVVEREPQLTYIDPKDPRAQPQIVDGLSSDGWMEERATVLLKRPLQPSALQAVIYIPPQALARHVQMLVDGRLTAENSYSAPGAYTLAALIGSDAQNIAVTLTVDRTFSVPTDRRALGIVVVGIGFRNPSSR